MLRGRVWSFRRGWRPRLLVAAFAAAVVVSMATAADAHALLASSEPAAGSTLARSPSQVVITFTEQPDPALSSIQVLDTSGHAWAGGRATVVAGQPATLRIAVPNLPNGVYTVSWRTVSRVDGHLAAGAYSFGVGVSPAGAPAPKGGVVRSPRPSGLAVASRWLYFAGIIGLLGLVFTELFVLEPEPAARRLRWWGGASWLLAAIGTAGITEAQRRPAHLAFGRLLASSLGHSLRIRGVPVGVAGVLVLGAALAPPRARRPMVVLAGIAALAAMLGDAATGHAAATTRWEWYRVGTQWAHFAAVGIWMGALAGFLLCLGALSPADRRVAARRFSTVAAFALLAVAATGTLRAVDEIGTWHQLFSTGFGQLVIAKVALLGGLALLGALNRYRSVPAADTRPTMLRRVGGSELLVGAVVLGVTAVLLNLAPARSTAAAAAKPAVAPIVIDAHDFATTVRLHVTVTPGTAGFNDFRVSVVDYDTRAPVDATVSLRFALPARPDLGQSTLPLQRTGPGMYAAQGANLSIDGTWTVSMLIQRPSGSVEVALTLTTRQPPQRIDVQHFSGSPDIYTLHLAGNRSIQTYLDPGHPGAINEFHATVIGPNGSELAMTSLTVSATGPNAGPPVSLTVRRLDQLGHFVADLRDAVVGRYSFEVNGTTAQGDTLHGVFTIPVR